jgi:predicted negative regulator of RcsB-dependent stress response
MSEYLRELTDAQLKDVAAAVDARIKDARKKATQALSKKPELLKSWVATLSKTSPDEDLAERVREERRACFEKALAESPDAFVLYHMSNYLRTLSEAVRVERLARAGRPKS